MGVQSGSDTRPSLSLGLGLKVPRDPRWSLRFEARGYATLTGGDRDLLCVGGDIGLECRVRYQGDVLMQGEALAGLMFRFK